MQSIFSFFTRIILSFVLAVSLMPLFGTYRKDGAEALKSKPKGRPKGSSSAKKSKTNEQLLEERVLKLEAENAYLKKLAALRAEKRRQTGK